MSRSEISQMALVLSRARGLTDWEKTFVQSVSRVLGEGVYLTAKVIARLEQIYRRRVLDPILRPPRQRSLSDYETQRLQEVWSPVEEERDKSHRDGWGR